MPEIESRQAEKIEVPPEAELSPIASCCEETLRVHSVNNPMMVCSDCKQIIKVFRETTPYRNYLRFCKSRHRKVLSAKYKDFWVVIFKSYETT